MNDHSRRCWSCLQLHTLHEIPYRCTWAVTMWLVVLSWIASQDAGHARLPSTSVRPIGAHLTVLRAHPEKRHIVLRASRNTGKLLCCLNESWCSIRSTWVTISALVPTRVRPSGVRLSATPIAWGAGIQNGKCNPPRHHREKNTITNRPDVTKWAELAWDYCATVIYFIYLLRGSSSRVWLGC